MSNVNASTSSASSYILMDASSGRVLLGKDINNPRLIASITKIMTCIIALENADIESIVIVDESIFLQLQSHQDSGKEIRVGYCRYSATLPWRGESEIVITEILSQ